MTRPRTDKGTSLMKPGMMVKLAASAVLLLQALPAAAQTPAPPNVESDTPPKTLGMDPQAPAAQALPGGTSPRMGEPAGADWRFDFHGILIAPLRVGFG